MNNYDVGITAKNLKCIGTSSGGLTNIALINIIIGRNNSGKSSLLDLIEISTTERVKADDSLRHNGIEPSVFIDFALSDELIRSGFPENVSGGELYSNHYEYGRANYSGARISARFSDGKTRELAKIYDPSDLTKKFNVPQEAQTYLNRICSVEKVNPFKRMEFRRLHAERNIQPETHNPSIKIEGDGRGATNAIQNFINNALLDREIVRSLILDDLNSIFGPDTVFDEIVCRHHEPTNEWEIFLNEKSKGLVSLSNSGSGLKTVILALCLIHLEPVLAKKPLDRFIFAYEELENNLHPAIQRKLLTYLAAQSVKHRFPLFLTTHSSIAIDLFNRHTEAQILHVTHNGVHSTITPVRAYIESRGILDDLDVRASDLLQSNGVLWVEGPSDRVYINHWINIWSNGELAEGNHYQCVFYGGRLLSHISSEEPEAREGTQGVEILRVNRNACILFDSDKRNQSEKLNDTKLRVLAEIEAIGGLGWVTDGREIENYVPFRVLTAWASELTLSAPPGRFDSIFNYLDTQKPGLGKKYEAKKAALAEALNSFTVRADLEEHPQLSKRLSALCGKIRQWNQLPEPTPPKPLTSDEHALAA